MDISTSLAAEHDCIDVNTLLRELAELKDKVPQLETALKMSSADKSDLVLHSDSDKVKVDVGGHIFVTSLGTIRKIPESMLATMFSGNWTLDIDRDGTVFLDRNPAAFATLLQYLRDYPHSVLCLHDLSSSERERVQL